MNLVSFRFTSLFYFAQKTASLLTFIYNLDNDEIATESDVSHPAKNETKTLFSGVELFA